MAVLDSVAKIAYGALKGEFKKFLILRTVETPSETEPWKINQKSTTQHECLAIRSSYKNWEIDGEKILKDDCKITILSMSIPDTLTDGLNKKTDTIKDLGKDRVWKIESIKIDPADATYRCQCR
jgi:hypothetical protein